MKNKFKNLILGTLLTSTLLIAPTKKAEAGFLLITLSPYPSSHEMEDLMTLSGFVTIVGGGALLAVNQSVWGLAGAALLIVLDAESTINPDQLKNDFAKIYPFIDNEAALKNLAILTQRKIPSSLIVGEKQLIRIDEKEVLKALEGADLSRDQLEKIVSDLK